VQTLYQQTSARDELVAKHTGLVQSIANRFANRGEPVDDLRQVGFIGLLKAVDRFDDTRGVAFATYGYAKITGEIRRYFRDKCWTIRIPRKVLDLHRTVEGLKRTAPADAPMSTAAMASTLERSESDVLRAEDLASICRPLSLDAALTSTGTPATLLEVLGTVDRDIEGVEIHTDIVAACKDLSEHERSIVRLRFFEEMTQTAIGAMLGKSQMYVSRVEKSALGKLRAGHRELVTCDAA
jgi:RNA polymerase sigma-B factor